MEVKGSSQEQTGVSSPSKGVLMSIYEKVLERLWSSTVLARSSGNLTDRSAQLEGKNDRSDNIECSSREMHC
jgi:hypothetical protein